MNYMTLHQLKQGASGKVIDFNGGCGLVNKLNSMGIREGKEITKISNSFIGGPVTVQLDNAKIAIGNGMAEKIIIEENN
ncbi:FeoA family protein [Acetohalobium arabaticum]|uniref:FeoA family protein n=1 Tax=Acetohalobium arabaticum (strain ATCC 49924 / DSM 5501 / Z-7288) TaxID=574087 RepID=D9QSS8_ACEAZ|nr:FeoA family protein [Acetohalobium arabaticum]ADL11616.1 FeoA family protein [Acetohalobium arabaticum DSM 5501]